MSIPKRSLGSLTVAAGAPVAAATQERKPSKGAWSVAGMFIPLSTTSTRIAYSEILNDEKAITAAGFWHRAAAWYASIGVNCERVITDNGSCYRSGLWHRACQTTGTTVKKTPPRRPQTNGKVERFHRILLEDWAYIQPWITETQRHHAYHGFIHFYNHHRSHGSLGWVTPTSTLKDNLPKEHT
jgi:hypothetical protein